jgi:hypothetical protein
MRFVIAVIAVFSIVGGSPLSVSEELNGGSRLVAAEQQPSTPAIDVEVDVNRGGDWWADPVWIAIGAVALVVLILLIAMAVRGGGTTVIKE